MSVIGTLGLSTFIVYMAYSAASSLCDPQYFAWVDDQCSPQLSAFYLIGVFVLLSLPVSFGLSKLFNELIKQAPTRIKAFYRKR
ncbi:hypothetical protein [Vibrio tubiashii]|uniref:hypothetical protein n=1 Tax=Vibrio tubiashii TaxID=29498 RepID=UPI00349E9C45